jgi:hypothetical protein
MSLAKVKATMQVSLTIVSDNHHIMFISVVLTIDYHVTCEWTQKASV